MKTKSPKLFTPLLSLVLSILLNLPISNANAQDTTFTYQGKLNDNGQAANGTNYGLVFNLYAVPTAGALLGSQTNVGVTVGNGLFSVPLNFGNVFDGTPRWL